MQPGDQNSWSVLTVAVNHRRSQSCAGIGGAGVFSSEGYYSENYFL